MTYVMADIHGNMRRFRSVMGKIRLRPEDMLYVLGDATDRHPDGIKILRQLMEMPNCKMLRGNHEAMMLSALGEPYEPEDVAGRPYERVLAHWYRNGGEVTLRSWKRQRKTVRRELLDYLKALPVNLDVTVNGRKFRLAHAAPLDLYTLSAKYGVKTAAYFAVWDREIAPGVPIDGYTLIFGHTPTEAFQEGSPLSVWFGENRVCIDCGSGFPDAPTPEEPNQGRLACLRLEDMEVFYSDEGE